MNDNPLVSIVIPVYNGSNYLREAIESALAQTYKNIEVLVINDGSNDGGATRDIALSYGERIRYFEKENGGVATALNLGIKEMKGEYFSWLSHDDVYYPWKIEKQIEFIQQEQNDEIILYGGFDIINEESEKIDEVRIDFKDRNTIAAVVYRYIHGCTMLIPTVCFKNSGRFNEKLLTTQDYDLWFRLLQKYSIYYVADRLIKSRKHALQGSRIIQRHSQENDNFYFKVIETLNQNKMYLLFANNKFFLQYAVFLNKNAFKAPADFSYQIHRKSDTYNVYFDFIIYKFRSISIDEIKNKIIFFIKYIIRWNN